MLSRINPVCEPNHVSVADTDTVDNVIYIIYCGKTYANNINHFLLITLEIIQLSAHYPPGTFLKQAQLDICGLEHGQFDNLHGLYGVGREVTLKATLAPVRLHLAHINTVKMSATKINTNGQFINYYTNKNRYLVFLNYKVQLVTDHILSYNHCPKQKSI